ncbi:hypothetical protein SAV31267_094100 [Streptomyces avermitilis]|uniref:Uncharacterized protein n=1 Tax=Streptomyces avermitilis TaxID=33903 RepID=A0A4D4N905_STRAX|nr:hypothetical protein SAV31267_094100 [Streptomyces avermitilis]
MVRCPRRAVPSQAVRSRFRPGTTRFLGDVLVYQRHRDALHARVRHVIDDVHPGLGRGAARPVRIATHSLGGVIAVDMATANVPLWTESLVTFGSQATFFHQPVPGDLLCQMIAFRMRKHQEAETGALPPETGFIAHAGQGW